MENLDVLRLRADDMQGSLLALKTFINALVRVLPTDVRAALRDELPNAAEVARTVLLNAATEEGVPAAFEREIAALISIAETPMDRLARF